MINPQKAVEWYKNKYGNTNYSDADIYSIVQRKFPQYEYPDDNPYVTKREPETPDYEEQNPGLWEKLLTANFADNFAEDSEWWANAYNKSMAGTVYEIIHGEKKYDVDPTQGWWNEVGQFFVGMASPIDVLGFFGSGAVGSLAGKSLAKNTLRKWAVNSSKELIKKKGALRNVSSKFSNLLANEAGLETGLSLGMLGATHGTLLEAAKQSSEIEQGLREGFDPWKMTWEGAKHGASNIGTGYAAGYLTKGLMAPKYAKARAAKNPSQQQTITKLTMNPVGQVAAEASVFTTGQVAQQLAMGEPVDTDSFMSGLFMNLGIVGGMRASTKILRIGQGDLERFTAAKKKFYKDIKGEHNTQKNALKTVEETYTKNGETPPKEIIEKLASLEVEKELSDVVLKEFGTTLKNVNDRMKLLNNKAPEKWTVEERAFVMKNNKIQMNLLYEVYRQMSANKEIAYEAYAKDFGTTKEKLTANDKLIIDKMIENKLAAVEKGDRVLNGLSTGDKNAIKEMNELMGESYDYKITEKNNKFELSVETPNEEKILIGTFDSKKEASNQSAAIKNIIKDKLEGQEVAPEAPSKVTTKVVKETPGEIAPVSEKPVIPIYSQYAKVGDVSKKPVNLRDNKKSTNQVDSEILSEIKDIKKMSTEQRALQDVSETIPMSKVAYEKKIKETNSIFTKKPAGLKPEEIIAQNALLTNKRTSIVKEKRLEDMSQLDRVVVTDYAKKIAREDKSIGTSLNMVTELLVKSKKEGKDLSTIDIVDIAKFFESKSIKSDGSIKKPSTNLGAAFSNFFQFAYKNKYIDVTKGVEFHELARLEFSKYNEYVVKGKNPPKKGVRKKTIEEAIKTGDESVEIAAKLGARYYIRDQEINKIAEFAKDSKSLNEILKFDKDTGEYYLKLPLKIAKTFEREVWIDKELSTQIKSFIEGGGSLKGALTKVTQLIKNKVGTDNPDSPFVDLRRMGKRIGKLDFDEVSKQDYMFGHNKNRIDAIYKGRREGLTLQENIKFQKELHKKMKSPIEEFAPKSEKDFYRPKISGETSKEIQLKRKRIFERNYPEIKYELEKVFKDKTVPEDAVGYLTKLEDWTVAVKLGKAPSDTIPHEISHYVFKLMNALENGIKTERIPITKNEAYTLRLVKEAKEIFKNKEGKFVEEDAVTMMGKAIDGIIEKPMMSKVKGFFKRFNILLKRLFNRKLDKEEIAYILGKRVLNRAGIPKLEIPGAKEFMRPVDMPVDKLVGSLKYEVRTSAKKLGLKESDLMKFVADTAEIKNPSKFRITLPKDSSSAKFETKVGELGDFYNTLKSFNLEKYVSKKNMIEKLSAIKRIESTNVLETQSRVSKGITLQQQKDILSAFGTKNGDIYQATLKQLKDYADYIYQQKAIKRDNIDWITRSEIDKFVNSDVASGLTRAKQEGLMLFGEVGDAIKSFGLKTLGKKLTKHYAIEQGNQAPLLFFEKNSIKILGPARGAQKAQKMFDNLWTLDNQGEMLLAQRKWLNEKISAGDKKRTKQGEDFFRKAIKEEWWNTVDKKGVRGKDLNKYINMETKEGQVAAEYMKLTNAFGKEKLELSLAKRANSQAEYEAMVNMSDVDFYSSYAARMLTNHARRELRLNGQAQQKIINKMASEIAYQEAVRRYGKKAVDKDPSLLKKGAEGESAWDFGHGQALLKFNDLVNFNPGKLSISNLKKRGQIQELYLEDSKGNLKRTYEWNYEKTVKPYVWGMSKFYATLEMFPEMVKFDGFKVAGMKEQMANLKLGEGRTRKMGRWVEETITKQLGLDVSSQPYDILYQGMGTSARWVSKVGLSFPTAGLKNILTGQTQALYTFRMADWSRGMLDFFTADAKKYNKAVGTNAEGVGNKIYEGGKMDRILDKAAFRFGFMRPTEKFNRLSVVMAASYDIQRQIGRLMKYAEGDKPYTKAVNRLKKFYELNEKDIALLKKYGDRDGASHLKGFEKFKAQRELDNIHQLMNTMAHSKTQGSTADLFMPKWSGSGFVKPLTLYKRMAYAATSNTIKNTKHALENGNILRPVMGMTATALSGTAMIGIYKSLLGTTMPKENADWWTRFKTIIWKGEFLGLFSEFFSPQADMVQSMNPAITNTLWSLNTAIGELTEGKATLGQASHDFFKKNISIYGNYTKVRDRTLNPENRDRIRINKLWMNFEQDVYEKPDAEFEKTTRTPYFRMIKDALIFKDKETYSNILASVFVALAHDYYRTNKAVNKKTGEPSFNIAFEMANKEIQKKFKNLNPNRATFDKENKAKAASFYKWLKKHPEFKDIATRMIEMEGEYKKKLSEYNSFAMKSWSKKQLKDLIKSFDWKTIKL